MPQYDVAQPIGWCAAEAWLATCAPGPETDEAIDELADEAVVTDAGPEAAPALIRALGLAQGLFTRRAAALALAASAVPSDQAAVDAIVAAYRAAALDAFLRPALIEALGLLAAGGGLARAAAIVELLRLDRTDERYLLVKAARIAGCLDAVRPEPDLRDRLQEWVQADDPAVQGEARQQIALILLAEALLASDQAGLCEALAEARAAFAAAEATEEHRPDAVLFRRLLDMVLALTELGSELATAAARIAAEADAIRALLTNLSQHDWHGYRSPRADVIAARVLATAGALERAATSVSGAATWLRLDEALQELAALYATVRGDRATATDRLDTTVGAVADIALAPAFGPILRRHVGRARLDAIVRNYRSEHGDDSIFHGLTVLVHEARGDTPGPLRVEAGRLEQLAERAGMTPDALVRTLWVSIERDDVNTWARSIGLPPATLPIDLPGLYGADPMVDTSTRTLLRDLRARLSRHYPRHTWEQLAAALASILCFARYTRDTLPAYMRCAEDGGKGRAATERDLQEDLFRWLDLRFGQGATYERQKYGGGRPDTGLSLAGCMLPIEVKHEFADVSREHIRASYLTQSDMYATARDGVAFLVVLDLREVHALGHRKHAGRRRRGSERPISVSLYSLAEGFWVDSLQADPQIEGAVEKPVIVGLFPGNRPLPSSTTTYSRRRDGTDLPSHMPD